MPPLTGVSAADVVVAGFVVVVVAGVVVEVTDVVLVVAAGVVWVDVVDVVWVEVVWVVLVVVSDFPQALNRIINTSKIAKAANTFFIYPPF